MSKCPDQIWLTPSIRAMCQSDAGHDGVHVDDNAFGRFYEWNEDGEIVRSGKRSER